MATDTANEAEYKKAVVVLADFAPRLIEAINRVADRVAPALLLSPPGGVADARSPPSALSTSSSAVSLHFQPSELTKEVLVVLSAQELNELVEMLNGQFTNEVLLRYSKQDLQSLLWAWLVFLRILMMIFIIYIIIPL